MKKNVRHFLRQALLRRPHWLVRPKKTLAEKKCNKKKQMYVFLLRQHCYAATLADKKFKRKIYIVVCSKHGCDSHIGWKSTREEHSILMPFQASQLSCVCVCVCVLDCGCSTKKKCETKTHWKSTASSCHFMPARCRVCVYVYIHMRVLQNKNMNQKHSGSEPGFKTLLAQASCRVQIYINVHLLLVYKRTHSIYREHILLQTYIHVCVPHTQTHTHTHTHTHKHKHTHTHTQTAFTR